MTDKKFFAQFENTVLYDYEDAVLESVREVLEDDPDYYSSMTNEEIIDELANDDSVTGNASGSFFCSRWKAQCCLLGNHSLIWDALENIEIFPETLKEPESVDVLVRYYVLTTGARNKAEALITSWRKNHA